MAGLPNSLGFRKQSLSQTQHPAAAPPLDPRQPRWALQGQGCPAGPLIPGTLGPCGPARTRGRPAPANGLGGGSGPGPAAPLPAGGSERHRPKAPAQPSCRVLLGGMSLCPPNGCAWASQGGELGSPAAMGTAASCPCLQG